MNQLAIIDPYGVLVEPTTMRLQRLLPGPVERIWAYLTDSELRRKWLASGDMPMKVGGTFELVWRNDEITEPAGARPAEFGEEMRMESRVTDLDPPHRISFAWGGSGDVSFELEPRGDQVLLTITHRNLADRDTMLMIGAGWHIHLDVLVGELTGSRAEPFWDGWKRLRKEYDQRLPA